MQNNTTNHTFEPENTNRKSQMKTEYEKNSIVSGYLQKFSHSRRSNNRPTIWVTGRKPKDKKILHEDSQKKLILKWDGTTEDEGQKQLYM